jgi:hypothetical protein
LVLPILVVLLAIPAATAHAVARMPVGFYDDPSFPPPRKGDGWDDE